MASLSRNWDQFETVVGLHELQLAYVSTFPRCPLPIKVVASLTHFPGKRTGIIRVPDVDYEQTIVVNGALAEYCDVISFGRLVQAKHTADGQEYTLGLTTELKKCGVTKTKEKLKSTEATALLRSCWGGSSLRGNVGNSAPKPKELEQTVQSESTTRHGAAVCKLSQHSDKLRIPFAEVSTPAAGEGQDSAYPISVVFVTNAVKFKIPRNESTLGIDTYIQRKHVDKDGALLDGRAGGQDSPNTHLQQYFNDILLQGVSVKFFFLEQDEHATEAV